MKKQFLILFHQTIFLFFLITSLAFAAPNINDGYMSYTSTDDWGGVGDGVTVFNDGFKSYTPLTNVSVEEGDYSGDNYDLEELGLYINDNMLYIGIQTNYNLESNMPGTYAGDFIFNFDESSDKFYLDNKDSDDFAFDFSVDADGSVDFTLLAGNLVGGTDTTDFDNYGKDWEITSSTYSQTFTNAGKYTYGNYDDSDPYPSGSNTIEAAINLNDLSDDLNSLFQGYAAENNSVTMFWQPSCGNDFLAARSDFSYTSSTTPGGDSPVPEPQTFLLFGIGLIGLGAWGRKKQKNENS